MLKDSAEIDGARKTNPIAAFYILLYFISELIENSQGFSFILLRAQKKKQSIHPFVSKAHSGHLSNTGGTLIDLSLGFLQESSLKLDLDP